MSRGTVRAFSPVAGLFLLAAATVVAACGGAEAPRIDVELTLDMPDSVPLDEPLHMTYTWAPGDDFEAPLDDYQVFVHVLDAYRNIVFQDDHYPTEPTSQWSTGQPQSYDRWLYLPTGLEVDRLDFVIGLYAPEGRVLLRGKAGTWTDAMDAHTLEVRVDDMSGVPAYIEGWHPAEGAPPEMNDWRWSEGVARVAFTNPRRDATLHITAHGPFDEVGQQILILRIGEAELRRIEINSAQEFSERVAIPAAAMGDNDWLEFTFEVSPILVPRDLDPESADERSLGLQVFRLYLSSS